MVTWSETAVLSIFAAAAGYAGVRARPRPHTRVERMAGGGALLLAAVVGPASALGLEPGRGVSRLIWLALCAMCGVYALSRWSGPRVGAS